MLSQRIRPLNPELTHPPKVIAAPTVKAGGAGAEARAVEREEDVAVEGVGG